MVLVVSFYPLTIVHNFKAYFQREKRVSERQMGGNKRAEIEYSCVRCEEATSRRR